MKKILAVFTALIITVSYCMVPSFAEGVYDYSPEKAIEKAEEILEQAAASALEKGLETKYDKELFDVRTERKFDCISFVRTCVEAGGIPVGPWKGITCKGYVNYLLNHDYAVIEKLNTKKVGKYTRILESENPGVIHKGDILLYQCTKEDCANEKTRAFHVELFSEVKNDLWYTYGSNPWKDSTAAALLFAHKTDFEDTKSEEALENVEVYCVRIVCAASGFERYNAQVSNLQTTLNEYDEIKIWWDPVEDADGYDIYLLDENEGTYDYLATTTDSYFIDSLLTEGEKYTYQIIPYQEKEITRYGLPSTTGETVIMKKAAKPKVTKVSTTKAKVKWTSVRGATGYEISKVIKGKTKVIFKTSEAIGGFKSFNVPKGITYFKVRSYTVVDGKKIYAPWSAATKYKR